MNEIEIKKRIQRKLSEENRKLLKITIKDISKQLLYNFCKGSFFKNKKSISSFISIKSEISTKFLNNFLIESENKFSLPVIINDSEILTFREFNFSSTLVNGKYGTFEPDNSGNEILPDIILTPCLAFDKKGFRLGYGGGYYDKTFSYLKKINHDFISIVVAYENQLVDEVVHDKFDQKINYILTEKDLYKVK